MEKNGYVENVVSGVFDRAGINTRCIIEETQTENKRKPTTLFEFLWGISEEEYNECVSDFAKLHGTTKENWEL